MNKAVLFSKIPDFTSVPMRLSIIRIPEVLVRLKRAQNILDELEVDVPVLLNHLLAPEDIFERDQGLKSMIEKIILLGFFDRLKRNSGDVNILMANSEIGEGLFKATSDEGFVNLIRNESNQMKRPSKVVDIQMGRQLAMGSESRASVWTQSVNNEGHYQVQKVESSKGLTDALLLSIDQHQVKQLIYLGPMLGAKEIQFMDIRDRVQLMDSIDVDPMLTWFYRDPSTFKMA